MGHTNRNKKNNGVSKSQWLGAFLLLFSFLIVGWVLIIQNAQRAELSSRSTLNGNSEVERANSIVINQINSSLKSAAIKGELLQKESEFDSQGAGELATEQHMDAKNGEPIPLSFEQENPAKRVLSDTSVSTRRAGRPLTPDQRISAKVQRDLWSREEERRREKEYVKQFILNAREKGIEIELNQDLEVIGIEDVREPEPLRFPQSHTPSNK